MTYSNTDTLHAAPEGAATVCCEADEACCNGQCFSTRGYHTDADADCPADPTRCCPFVNQPVTFPRRDPEPEPEPAECCPAEGPVCCSGKCISLEDSRSRICLGDSSCCDETGETQPVFKPTPFEFPTTCCEPDASCCGATCVFRRLDVTTDRFCPPVAGGCCGPPDAEEVAECCAREDCVCCNDGCFPPGQILAGCYNENCGCPSEH